MLNKSSWNRIINALSLIAFCLMISTGMIMKWILPPGSGRAERFFSGGREKKMFVLLGMNRHEWGDIHFYISIAFLTLLAVHLALHWKWIQVTAWGTRECPQPWRRKLATIFIVGLILVSFLLPWMLSAEIRTALDHLNIP